MEKVIFDTNRLYNKQGTTFLAKSICKLENFQKVSEIIIPDIVIGELENKYKRDFEEEKEKFVKTILNSFLSHDADKLSAEEKIVQLKENETIKYEVIELKNTSVLFEMKNLALKKEPPFKKSVKEDPGFKDAYIYFTVLEYLQTCTDKYIFVCTQDVTLKEALQKHQNIKVVKDFEEFKQESISLIHDEYFISKLKESVHENITASNIIDYWVSINGNQILLIEIEDEKFLTEIEEREIVQHRNEDGYRDLISELIESPDWGTTHRTAKQLNSFLNFLSVFDAQELINALLQNDQIYTTLHNSVRSFYWGLFDISREHLDEEVSIKVQDIFAKTNYQQNNDLDI